VLDAIKTVVMRGSRKAFTVTINVSFYLLGSLVA